MVSDRVLTEKMEELDLKELYRRRPVGEKICGKALLAGFFCGVDGFDDINTSSLSLQ